MTPKEKSEELIELFRPYAHDGGGYYKRGTCSKEIENSKSCALICVNEILKAGNSDMIVSQYFDDRFWNGVKEELNNL